MGEVVTSTEYWHSKLRRQGFDRVRRSSVSFSYVNEPYILLCGYSEGVEVVIQNCRSELVVKKDEEVSEYSSISHLEKALSLPFRDSAVAKCKMQNPNTMLKGQLTRTKQVVLNCLEPLRTITTNRILKRAKEGSARRWIASIVCSFRRWIRW